MMTIDQFFEIELPKINTTLKKHLGESSDHCLKFDFPEINLSDLINHATCEKIFYFKSKYKDFTFLGLGHSKTVKGHELKNFISTNPDLLLTTDFSFEKDPIDSDFILPEWIFITRNHMTELLISKSFEYKNYSAPNLFFNLNFDLYHYDPFTPPWSSYEEYPEHDQWTEMINACNRYFESGELEKIVMSRKKIFTYNESLDPISFFKALLIKNNTQNSYQIFNQSKFGEAFLSITPERLFSIEDNKFESISLAASAPRGKTPEEDLEFEQILKTSDKLTREHNLVTAEIVKKLSLVSKDIQVSPLETMKLPYIQHRAANIKAALNENENPIDLISLLHPTPAVGGLPWDKARSKIMELEPYKRKQYAAPIGVISAHYSELAVGIRSATIEKETLSIFGGAGIVKGSIPEEEWVETGTKMNPFLKVVNHE